MFRVAVLAVNLDHALFSDASPTLQPVDSIFFEKVLYPGRVRLYRLVFVRKHLSPIERGVSELDPHFVEIVSSLVKHVA